ncbi:MAG: AIPR family protein [Alphaproteobacteria bacterium]|nr:AIPR family protein [Alphaproteobacteria bacterium]MBU0799230.1 AIPR family protein [Alphaproteobacteria bacterium]MBU0887519.1 AIPR family protein [Alphaproteobacteria bacterium]MBU1814756.1 AIPR family protein [Alphaproteobacteria bacterium]
MEQTVEEFFHDFRQETLAGAEANSTYQLEAFMEAVSRELIETGFVEGFEHCHYRTARGIRVDGYWFNDEGALDIFVADFDCRRELETLTRTDVDAAFKRVVNFFEASLQRTLEPDVTTPEYGLVRQIADRRAMLRQANFYLTSERVLSDRFQAFPDGEVSGIRATYHIWDMARFQRQRSSRGHKELLNIDFVELFGNGIACLPANLGSESYQSYLIVMPAPILAALYDRYSARLLEQNVRTFLQARAQVNKGIRSTIINEPQMFFAYNNGITATAQEVETRMTDSGLQIVRMTDLQIVNGGQTTASLFHTRRRDKVDLSDIFVQMKLSVIDSEQSEMVVPRISEYANTQNRVNAADFFSNHPFHVRMAEFSRRIWAPAHQGAQRETKWFYERARGQYVDAQSKLTAGEQKRFQAEYPKTQMFTKTDLAKFENVFDDHPRWVNLGSQKNFARYALRIGKEWEKSSDGFNELYFKRAIARGILFRATEKLVSAQPWYNGGYRANIVAYTLSMLGEITKRRKASVDYHQIWTAQNADDVLLQALIIIAKAVNEDIIRPPQGIFNISEWCKKEGCWTQLFEQVDGIAALLPEEFWVALTSVEDNRHEAKTARQTQKIDNGIEVQKQVFEVPTAQWALILKEGTSRRLLTPKEMGILQIAEQIPVKIPTEKQCAVLMEILGRAHQEGLIKELL